MKIIKFEADTAKGDDHNGLDLIIGQHLPRKENQNHSHINVYGIALNISDTSKDYQLHEMSCHRENLSGVVVSVTKEEARNALIIEIDKALEIMFNVSEMVYVNENLNCEEIEVIDDEI